MSFYGSSFSYDGISCEEYGLMLYDFNNASQGDSKYATGQEIVEDRIPRRLHPIFYGTKYKEPLKFNLVFGEKQDAASSGIDIDRQKMELVGSWISDRDSYKWLIIDQGDMENVRYKCILTDLKVVEYAGNKWAFSCTAVCDSPYGYTFPQNYSFISSGESGSNVILNSLSSMNLPYYPKLKITLKNESSVSIINESDSGREFKLINLPQVNDEIFVDGENGIIKGKSDLNLYNCFNFNFPRLVRGENNIKLTGDFDVEYICEFPVNIGG